MSLQTLRFTVGVFTAALAVTGCRRDIEAENQAEREANATKVTADSTDDATEPIVDKDFGFRLAPPPGWKLLREHDARSLNADAIAGAFNAAERTYGIVIVEPMPGTTLEQAVALLWQDPPPELVLESEQDIEFQGVAAKRRVFTAKIQGQSFHYVTTVFLRQEHLYQLMSWSKEAQETRAQLAFHEAFEFIEGEVRGRSTSHEPVTHADGVGWRIREGRYESALSGLRLPAGWRFIVGTEHDKLQTDAEIVATNAAGNMFVALVVERASPSRLDALAKLARQGFMDGQAPVGDPVARELADQRVEFRRYQQAPIEHQNGVYVGDDAITSVLTWYPQALDEDAIGPIDAVLAAIERIPANERATLHEQLLATPNHQQRFSTDRAFRAGEFLDFEHQLRWTTPPGLWSVDDFDKALLNSAETVLSAAELELGIYVVIEAWDADGDEPADTLEFLIESDELISRDTIVIDGLTIHRAQTVDRTQDPPTSYAFAITRRDQRMSSMMAWSNDDSPAIRATMQAALAGLDYAPELERTRIVGRTYTDLRYGFSFGIPAGFDDPPQIRNLGLGQVTGWTKGKQELVSLVLTGISDDEEWMSSFFEQIIREQVSSTRPLGKPESSDGLLGGHPARQLTWKADGVQLQLQIVARGPLLFGMLYVNVSDAQRERVQASWTLLE